MKTWDTKEAFLLTLKYTKRKMPRIPAHLRERALGMLQGGMRTADVARAINCNVRLVRCLRQRYRETGRTADRPRSGRPHVTTPAHRMGPQCLLTPPVSASSIYAAVVYVSGG